MAPPTSIETLHDVKRHLDNGFNGKQIAKILPVSESLVVKVRKGGYGLLPKFPCDDELKRKLYNLCLEQMHNKPNINRKTDI